MRIRAEKRTITAITMISNNDCNIHISYQVKKLTIFFQISRSNLSVTPRACYKRKKEKEKEKEEEEEKEKEKEKVSRNINKK